MVWQKPGALHPLNRNNERTKVLDRIFPRPQSAFAWDAPRS
jgi:hypothetical protein